ncbi:hypothetical protein G7046_g2634 [Stylonectria norvegica]|nr:hypothetical protein G7046_g2634 [Stylonectria norvegica]
MSPHDSDNEDGETKHHWKFRAMNYGDGTLQGTSLMTTEDGQIAYPGFVPPSIHSPEPPESSAREEEMRPEERKHKAPPKPRQQSEPVLSTGSVPKLSRSTSRPQRPSPSQNWKTEAPRRGQRRHSLLRPLNTRAGTSYLNKAIWEGYDEHDDSTSSSDTEIDDEDNEDFGRRVTSPMNQVPNRRQKLGMQKMRDNVDHEDKYRKFSVGNQNYQTRGKVKRDGRLRITVNETANTGYLAKALGAALLKVAPPSDTAKDGIPKINLPEESPRLSEASTAAGDIFPRPRLNIVIMVIGSRGDAQPFLKIGKVLKEDYGHRVRIATHPAFREFVEKDSGLEFFSVGGDPSELMAFMVKNPGLIPTMETVKAGDIGKRRAAMAEMFDGFWRACINATDDEKDYHNLKMMGAKDPFVADAIIANPPSFAHIHCAEALGIPVHMMFTFPYTPTQAFPHPLASIKKSNVDPGYTNFISYPLVEMMVWQGLGDLVNDFRVKTLALDPVSTLWAPGATYRLHVPYTYLWSPGLVPKPQDWGSEIDVAGFVFLDLASSFKPPKELEEFLAAGETPIYIGFGSIVVDDADRFTQMIFDAVEMAGVRALVSKGWGGLGAHIEVPDSIFLLENTPHDWLFPKIKACVIHGGAGTTAIALKCGKPTMVVPFFGDQNFWGKMLGKAGVGPEPVPYKFLDVEKLADGIAYLLTPEAEVAAMKIAKSIVAEGDGAVNAVRDFHRQLNLRGPGTMRCSILKDKVSVWQLKGTSLKLSALAAELLIEAGLLSCKRLRLIRHTEWNDFEGPGEPVTGVAGSIAATFGEAFRGVVGVPYHMAKRTKLRKAKKEKRRQRKELTDAQNAAHVSPEGSDDVLDTVSMHTQTTAGERCDVAEQYVGDITSGVGRTATAFAKAPVNLSVALAQGFHNAPRLYGDDTVRNPIRVTGIRSGLHAARSEFVYGIYDGFTGVIRLPVRGAKQNGVVGFVKGTGMGLTGLVLKNLAAVIGPVGFTLKGIVKQAERSKTPQTAVRRARMVQGQREASMLPEDEHKKLLDETVEGWRVMKGLCNKIEEIQRQRGLPGQIERVLLDKSFLFEDVEIARRSLQALDRGETVDSLVHPGAESRHCAFERRSTTMRRSLNLPRKSKDEPRASSEFNGKDRIGDVEKTIEKPATAQGDRLAV